MKCPKCNAEMRGRARYCQRCGRVTIRGRPGRLAGWIALIGLAVVIIGTPIACLTDATRSWRVGRSGP